MEKKYTVPNGLTETLKKKLVENGDRDFDRRMDVLAEQILSHPTLRFIGLTGPTCSGKTTAANKLCEIFAEHSKRLHVISIDDFYYDKEYLHRLAIKNGREELDYDSEETIDVEKLQACVESLLSGKETQLPHFNFHTGTRENGKILKPMESDLFMFEGIQVLYPSVARILSLAHCQTVYIAPMTSIEVNGVLFEAHEIRFLRRLVRDFRFRNTSPLFTFQIWQSVRANEEAHIFPYIGHCDYFVDSTMPGEVGILKPYLTELLEGVPKDAPFAKACEDILKALSGVEDISDQYLSEKSLYKEFI